MKRSLLPLVIAILAALALIAAGLGARAGIWDFRTGFVMLKWAAYAGLAAALLALLFLFIPGIRRRQYVRLLLAFIIGAVVVFVPWSFKRKGASAPPIHDITTDIERPPEFVAVLPLRASAPNPAAYGGPEIAAQQQQAYPDIQPLQLPVSTDSAFHIARAAIEDEGWELVAADAANGRLEATATTTWFGFKDDVVVRIEANGAGSRIDARSVSRVGRGDVGANAARIRDYFETITDSME